MTSKQLIDLIQGDKTKLKKWFDSFDNRSSSIADWCVLLSYPKGDNYSYQICHKIRNHIASGLSYHFGVPHLDDKEFKGLCEIEFKQAIEMIEKGESVRNQLLELYPKIAEIIY